VHSRDDIGFWSLEFHLHLHRLDHSHNPTALDAITNPGREFQQSAGHR
jgi:hypothetical protein